MSTALTDFQESSSRGSVMLKNKNYNFLLTKCIPIGFPTCSNTEPQSHFKFHWLKGEGSPSLLVKSILI